MMWTCVFGVLTVVMLAEAWPNVYDNEFKRWSLSRRSSGCKETGGKCYSTSDCCKKYVCAAIDEDDSGLNPTTPGYCVHEKELDPCVNNLDCGDSQKCVKLGPSRYCVTSRPRAQAFGTSVFTGNSNAAGGGGLGFACNGDDDCNVYHSNGKDKLCCQRIMMGRGGVKQRCDRITPISKCISKRK